MTEKERKVRLEIEELVRNNTHHPPDDGREETPAHIKEMFVQTVIDFEFEHWKKMESPDYDPNDEPEMIIRRLDI